MKCSWLRKEKGITMKKGFGMTIEQKVKSQLGGYFLESIVNEMIVIDRKGTVVFCNPPLFQMVKRQSEEILGRLISDILPQLTQHMINQDGKIHPNGEVQIDNQVFMFNSSPVYENSEWIGNLIVFQNVTPYINKSALQEKRVEQYENALKLLSECIMGVDEQGNISFLSDSYAEFLGFENPKSAIGKHCTEVVENTRMHIVINTGQAEIGHIQRLKGKSIIAIRIPIFEEGKIIGAIGKIMFQDIREFKVLANQINTMESKLDYYKKELQRLQGSKYSFQNIIGNSEKMKEVKTMAMKVAKSRSTILIRGESGTGKELFAHAIHRASPRAEGPFIRINCAAIPRDLLEAELFGYEDGAFTGAKKGGKPGKVELAKDGTLFLDEIGDMPMDMQAKLLRVLQEKEIERIGGTKISQIDVRFIAATHQDLSEMVREGKFREDLFYRLNVFAIEVPPLRERKEDIIPITEFLIEKLNHELSTNVIEINDQVNALFMDYHWPGNIRELENILERSMNVVEGNIIQVHHLPMHLKKRGPFVVEEEKDVDYSLQSEVELAERRAIVKALKKASGNRQEAAKLLGIHRASLYRKMEKFQIEEETELKGE
jgi:transcriptional regulator with PAS, ATPase and Fis domain